MTVGDNLRALLREFRRFKETKGTFPSRQDLAIWVKLPEDQFDEALQSGVDGGWLIYDEKSHIISEGEKLVPQPTPDELKKPPIKKFAFAPGQQPLWERIFTALLVVAFLSLLAIWVFQRKDFSPQLFRIVKVFLSLFAASVAAFLPGMFLVDGKRPGLNVRASASLGVFLVVFWTA
jgi:hypothetical protein